jgi:hypothetical protein
MNQIARSGIPLLGILTAGTLYLQALVCPAPQGPANQRKVADTGRRGQAAKPVDQHLARIEQLRREALQAALNGQPIQALHKGKDYSGEVVAIDPVADRAFCCYVRVYSHPIQMRPMLRKPTTADLKYYSQDGHLLGEKVVGFVIPEAIWSGKSFTATVLVFLFDPPKNVTQLSISVPDIDLTVRAKWADLVRD